MDRITLQIRRDDTAEDYTYELKDPPLSLCLIALMKHFPDFDSLMRGVVSLLDSHHPTAEDKPIRDALQKMIELEKYARG